MGAPPTFLMSGEGDSFRPAEPCPMTAGPHNGSTDNGTFLVADAKTRDGTASVRLALWRCDECGSLLVGVGSTDVPLEDHVSGWAQDFTWLEQVPMLLDSVQAAFNQGLRSTGFAREQ